MNIAIARATVSRISWGGRLPQGIEQEGLDPLGFQQPFELQRSDARVGLAQLARYQVRNHADALIVPDHGFILLTGDNGAGKTNILEAVSLLAG